MTDPKTQGPILITGATGFVGEHLLRRLADADAHVVGTGLSRSLTVPGRTVVQTDLRDAQAVQHLLNDVRPSIVFHCAAQTNVSNCQQHPQTARTHIVDATQNLTNALTDTTPDALLVALSTDLVFDGEHAPYIESDPTGPVSAYGCLKLEAEQPVLAFPRGSVIRTSLVFGPRSTHKGSFLAWMLDTLTAGETLTLFEDEVRTPIFVDDLCDAMIEIASRGETGLWHAGSQTQLSRVAIGKAVCKAFKLDEGLIRSVRLADSTYPAPRARDVSLDSTKLWSALKRKPLTLSQALDKMAKDRNRPS